MRVVHLCAAAAVLGAFAGTAGAQATPTSGTAPAQPAAAAAPAARPAPAKLPADSVEIARKYTRWFYTSLTDSLVAHTNPGGRTADAIKGFYGDRLSELTGRAGTETEVLEEKFITRNGQRQYWRTAKFSDFAEPLLIRFVIDEKGTIFGFGMGPKSSAPPIDP
jgi:hypothetical protein